MSRAAAVLALVCLTCGGAPAAIGPPPPPPPLPAATSPLIGVPAQALGRHGEAVFGHVLAADPAGTLADVAQQIVPAPYRAFLAPDTLLAIAASQLPIDGSFVHKIDLRRPLGCVFGDLAEDPSRVACVIGYQGGAKALARDLGLPQAANQDSAVLEIQGLRVHLDALGGDVVVSFGPGFFGEARAYLESNLLARRPGVDLELVGFTHDFFARHGELLAALAAMDDEDQRQGVMGKAPASARAYAEPLFAGIRDLDALGTGKLGEIEQLSLVFNVDAGGASLGYHYTPRPGGPYPAASLTRGRRFDPTLAQILPAGPLVLFGYDLSPRALLAFNRYNSFSVSSEDVERSLRMWGELWSAVTGEPASIFRAAVDRELAESGELYTGDSVWSVHPQPGGPLGLGLLSVYRLNPGARARDAWLEWTRRATPEAVLGATGKDSFGWSFTPDAYRIDGLPVDRWNLRPYGKAALELAVPLAAFSPTLATEGLTIDRLEVHEHVYFAIAPGAEEPLLRRALAAYRGQDSLREDAGLAAALGRDHEAFTVMSFDIAALGKWAADPAVRAVVPELDALPAGLGRGLDDVLLTFTESEAGVGRGEFMFGPGALASLQTLVLWKP